MAKKSTTFKVGRDARTGKFIPVKQAERRKSTTVVVETIKKKNSIAIGKSPKPCPKLGGAAY